MRRKFLSRSGCCKPSVTRALRFHRSGHQQQRGPCTFVFTLRGSGTRQEAAARLVAAGKTVQAEARLASEPGRSSPAGPYFLSLEGRVGSAHVHVNQATTSCTRDLTCGYNCWTRGCRWVTLPVTAGVSDTNESEDVSNGQASDSPPIDTALGSARD